MVGAADPLNVALDGGRYTAVRADDGTWSILDVPVYPEHVLPAVYDANGVEIQPPIAITKAWLEAAVRRAKFRATYDQHVAAAHVNHHAEVLPPGSPVRDVLPAGLFMARRVGTLNFGGRPTACIYGDFCRIPPERFADIEAGKLRYRSVEVLDLRDPEVSSVAFLPTQVPYFRLPMVTIGTKRAEAASAVASLFRSHRRSPVVASYRAGAAASALCYFAEAAPMADEKPGKKPADDEKKGPGPSAAADAAPPPAAPAEPPAAPAAAPAPVAPPAPAAPPAAPGAPGAPGWADPMAAVTACIQRIEQGLTLLLEKAGIAPKDDRPAAAADASAPGAAVPGPRGMSAPVAAPAPAPAAASAAAAQSAELVAARAELAAEKAANAREATIGQAVARLRPFFIPEPELRADLARAYQAGGAPQVAAYAETIERRFPAIPPTDLETRTQAAGDGGATPSDSKAVMAYQAKGPDAVRAARVFSRTYQRLKRNLNGITEDQFLKIQFDTAREGLDVPGDGE